MRQSDLLLQWPAVLRVVQGRRQECVHWLMPDTDVKTRMIDPSPRLEGLLCFSSGLDQMEKGVSLPLVLG